MRTWLFAAVLLGGTAITPASAAGGDDTPSDSMTEFGPTSVQPGYLQFCNDYYAGECGPFATGDHLPAMTPPMREKMEEVNAVVNRHVTPITDRKLWGVEDHWSYPVQRDGRLYGDCEDYVLEKRRLLMEMGWPPHSLLVTVVFDTAGGGHAVLTVATKEGDFILDNIATEILYWHATPYRFVKRQSRSDPNKWVSLRRAPTSREVAVAGSD